MKKFLWILSCAVLAVCLLFILPTEAHAAEIVDSGTCGENLTWSLDDDGVLTISGTGIMTDFAMRRPIPDVIPPWYNNRTAIQKVVIESGTTSIGSQAFEDCTNLSAVSIPDTVQTIGRYAFRRCSNLRSVCIPEGVISIDTGAFIGCEMFLWIELPRSLQTIGESAFKNSGSNYLTRHIVYGGTKSQWDQIEIGHDNTILTSDIGATRHYNASARLTQKETCSLLCWKCSSCGCFAAMKKTTHNHEFKDGVCATCGVDENWQYGLTSDGKIQINGYLGDEPYLKIPSYIEGYPVKKLASPPIYPNKDTLLAIFIPSSVDYIGGGMSHFPNLKHVIYGGSSNAWDDAVTSTVSSATRYHFGSNSSKVSYVETCETILLDCTDCGCFTAYQKPTSGHTYVDGLCIACGTEECWEYEVTTYRTVIITKYTGSKTEITVPAIIDGMPVTAIDSFAFENNVTLEAITIGSGIRRFAPYAFYGCSGLKSITIPDSVTSIDMCAFDGCTGLKDVIYTGAKAQWYDINIDTGNDPLNIAWLHCMKCCVTFINADGTILSEKLYNYGDTVEVPGDPTRASDNTYTYTFAGWDKTVVVCAGDTTYTATYTPIYIDYTITFKNWDGTVLSTNTYHYGDAVTAPTNPTKVADDTYTYIFKDWGETVAACNSNKTYTAVFTPQHIDYTVTFKNWNGSVISTQTYHYGDVVTVPTNPTKAADNTYTYTFAGWDKTVTKVTGDVVYTATYAPVYISYTVIFQNYDGTLLNKQFCHYGDSVLIPGNPSRYTDETYTYAFAGWDNEVTKCYCDKVYTATYTPTYRDYIITFINYDGSVISEQTYNYGDTVTPPADPTRASSNTYKYTFQGWDSTVTACTGSKTYTATYTPSYINYTVVFKNWDGTLLSSKTYHYGDKVIAPNNPTRQYDTNFIYTFAGWDKSITTCTGNEVYTATYSKTEITISNIVVTTKPTKLTYIESTMLDDAGMVLTVYYNNGTDKTVTTGWVSEYDFSEIGTAVVKVTYGGKSCAYNVTVVAKKLAHITIESKPSKLSYLEGDATLNTNGLSIRAHYDNDTSEVIVGNYAVTGYNSTPGTKTITVTYSGTTATFTVEVVALSKNGWVEVDGKKQYYINERLLTNEWECIGGKWYIFDANGYVLTNKWQKDSKGWVYVGADGAMLTNAWCTDSKGWCYVGADGYAVTNCWKKDSVGWIWLNANGSMTKSAWVDDGGKWYFLDANGYMVSNKWMKDSKGWVYLGSSGAMQTNAWCKDSVGWCYVGADGYCVTNKWVKDLKGWCYLNVNGNMVVNNWVQSGGKWYFMDANGYMISNTSKYWNGKKYYFNASGVCTNP